ncbi:hypothetical protein [Pseudarthrobacter sp. IC2-21]|uniref:hypothetical protein n=1 Tax=Pseudarthrobacter sp. IC2-21 TaxID=3092262 RepID=UPI002A6A2F49|nr:hypothetical protein [Pseudarthrobacter sp. IC2-21]
MCPRRVPGVDSVQGGLGRWAGQCRGLGGGPDLLDESGFPGDHVFQDLVVSQAEPAAGHPEAEPRTRLQAHFAEVTGR